MCSGRLVAARLVSAKAIGFRGGGGGGGRVPGTPVLTYFSVQTLLTYCYRKRRPPVRNTQYNIVMISVWITV